MNVLIYTLRTNMTLNKTENKERYWTSCTDI